MEIIRYKFCLTMKILQEAILCLRRNVVEVLQIAIGSLILASEKEDKFQLQFCIDLAGLSGAMLYL